MTRAVATLLTLALVLAVLVGTTTEAQAFERQHRFGLDGGLSMLAVNNKTTADVGAGLGLHYSYGLSDAFNFVAEGTSSIVALKQRLDDPTTPHTYPSTLSTLGVGVVYVFDVLQWIPYAGALADGYMMTGGTLDNPKFFGGVEIAIGLDYQLTRSWAVGIAGRQHMILTDISDYPSYTTIFGRVEYVWGW